jgi:hypothetical protein
MESLIRAVMTLGPPVFGLALILLPVFYLSWRSAPDPKKSLSLQRYLLLSLGAGVLAFMAGMAAGIFIFCSVEKAGNLCGLVGVFGLGPLLSGIVVAGVAYVLTRAPKEVPLGDNAKRAP